MAERVISMAATSVEPRREQMRFAPLRWLPDRRERLKSSRSYLGVAGHEAGHLLTAMSLGYAGDVSFIPDGHSLARVSLHGDVPVEDMKVIAAAGMVDTPFGSAFGFGSDKFKIRLMNLLYGGKNVGESQSAASSRLKAFGPIMERFSEILAYFAANGKPNVSARGIEQIYQRALFELTIEKTDIKIKPHEEDIRTIISEKDGYIVVTKVKLGDDSKTENYNICSRCLGKDQHYPDCPTLRRESKNKVGTPTHHRIFDWESRIKQLARPELGFLGQAIGWAKNSLLKSTTLP